VVYRCTVEKRATHAVVKPVAVDAGSQPSGKPPLRNRVENDLTKWVAECVLCVSVDVAAREGVSRLPRSEKRASAMFVLCVLSQVPRHCGGRRLGRLLRCQECDARGMGRGT
jgi:hypothetical protein